MLPADRDGFQQSQMGLPRANFAGQVTSEVLSEMPVRI